MTPHELRTRLALDAEVIARLRSPHLGAIQGFVDAARLAQRTPASPAELAGGRATFWTVEFRQPMLAGPSLPLQRATAVFNLLAGSDYPFSPPVVSFVTRPLPWCGHVHPQTGAVCLGQGWVRARGQITLGHLVVHVMRLLNFDEPPTRDGYNGSALHFGQGTLHGQPLTPELVYPALPADLLHGVPDEAPEPSASVFLPRLVAAPESAGQFVPRARVAPPAAGIFVPRGVAR